MRFKVKKKLYPTKFSWKDSFEDFFSKWHSYILKKSQKNFLSLINVNSFEILIAFDLYWQMKKA